MCIYISLVLVVCFRLPQSFETGLDNALGQPVPMSILIMDILFRFTYASEHSQGFTMDTITTTMTSVSVVGIDE